MSGLGDDAAGVANVYLDNIYFYYALVRGGLTATPNRAA